MTRAVWRHCTSRFDVHRVLGRDDYRISEFLHRRRRPPIGKDIFRCNTVFIDQALAINFPRLSHADNLHLVGMGRRVTCIPRAPAARSNDE